MSNEISIPAKPPVDEIAINEFISLVQSGIEAWTKAGKILVKLKASTPDCFDRIRQLHPDITLQTLLVFERIGRNQIYAPILADSSFAARRLLDMPYAIQKKYWIEPLEVVQSWQNGKIKTKAKRLAELTKSEVSMVFGPDHIRTPEQQAFRLREREEEKNMPVETSTTVDIGYYALACDSKNNVSITPCGKSGLAQPVRVLPVTGGWKTAIIVFYRLKSDH